MTPRPVWEEQIPGVLLVAAVAAVAWVLGGMLREWSPLAPDAVVIALVGGMAAHAMRPPGTRGRPGVDFVATRVLEWAIVLLGAGTDLRVMAQGGPWLAATVVGVTVAALVMGLVIGRWCGLSSTHRLLVASGNAICGNSAIAAVASVVRAPAREVVTSIGFTAVLSIGLVLVMPLVGRALTLSDFQYGVAAGMTVYAVPQVLAATYPYSVRAGDVAALVKVMRVLLLMPLLAVVAWRTRSSGHGAGHAQVRLLPPYLLAFLALSVLRTAGVIPAALIPGTRTASHVLTVAAMAALGLQVTPGAMREAGWRTAIAATGALVALLVIALFAVTRIAT